MADDGLGDSTDDSLRQAAEAHARARVRRDLAAYAAYMTPQALVAFHRIGDGPLAGTPRAYRIQAVRSSGFDRGDVDVKFGDARSGSYVVRSSWERRDGLWKVVSAAILPGSMRQSWWRRALRLGKATASPAAERRDLR
jgi:hypothetical protein